MRARTTVSVGLTVLVALFLSTLPQWGTQYARASLSLLFMWIGLAVSWNLISGMAGYLSFGHTAFFGLGAYAGTILFSRFGVPWVVSAIAAGLIVLLISIPLSFPLLRIHGPYFALTMLGVSEALRILAQRLIDWTGGGVGLYLAATTSIWGVYLAFLATATAAVVTSIVVRNSVFGSSLIAIREDEEAAAVVGVNARLEKTKAFVASAFFPAILGALYGQFTSYVSPSAVFRPTINLTIIVMAMLGGLGTTLGPVVGAIVVGTIYELLWASTGEAHMLIFGLVLLCVVLVLPGGIVGGVRTLYSQLGGRIFDRATTARWGT